MNVKDALKAQPFDLVELETKVPGQTDPAYFYPPTCFDLDKISKAAAREAEEGQRVGDGMVGVLTVIYSLVDKDGKPIFTLADKQFLLKKVKRSILNAWCVEINREPTIEEAEKN